jgi:anti-anti-sigma regulatory factor
MPGESTRRQPNLHVLQGGQRFEIRQHEGVVRVALTGILDRETLQRVMQAVAPRLCRRGQRVVLDGNRLEHLDYRAAGELFAWNRALSDFGHALRLAGWRPYLKTILLLADLPTGGAVAAGAAAQRRGTPTS